jgi:hypothetical protein
VLFYANLRNLRKLQAKNVLKFSLFTDLIEGTSTIKDYEREIIDISTFIVDDYEVFQVKKKI